MPDIPTKVREIPPIYDVHLADKRHDDGTSQGFGPRVPRRYPQPPYESLELEFAKAQAKMVDHLDSQWATLRSRLIGKYAQDLDEWWAAMPGREQTK